MQPPSPLELSVVDDVACTICGCVCDDIKITVADGRVVQAERACVLAEPWFLSQNRQQPPVAQVAGREALLSEAVEKAAGILRASRAPLIYGLSRSSTPGQRAAVRLADCIGAIVDTTASRCHGPSIMAVQEVGESTGTLGEFRNRCDLVIFWGSNPVESHPRHFERYSVDPVGQFVERGRSDRHVVIVDVQRTASVELADSFIQVEAGNDFEALWTLRCLVRGVPLERDRCLGADPEQLAKLAERMKACRSGIVYFGLGLARNENGHRAVEALLRLVTDLNAHTRFYARRMRVPGDVAGADSVLCWQTGFPFSVNLNRGYPRYNPGEYSASESLERGEVDACLLVGSEGIENLSIAAKRHLQSIPTVVLDYPTQECAIQPHVKIITAIYGVHLTGTAYRMDETPIPLRSFLPTVYPSDADVLNAIQHRLPDSPPTPLPHYP